jgi:hypothetical protein
VVTSIAYRELGEAAWSWVLSHVREDEGPWLPATVSEDGGQMAPAEDRDSLYAGIGGLAPVLAEIAQYRGLRDVEQVLAAGVVARLSTKVSVRTEPSLYDGLAGDVTALKLLAPGTEPIALQRLADLMTPAGWNTTIQIDPGSDAPVTDLVLGTAGVVLAAIWAGGEHADAIATTGGESLLRASDMTEAGLDWAMVPGSPSRMPNYSHGTAGVAAALAIAGGLLESPGLHPGSDPGRPAPPRSGLAGRRRLHRPAHHPALHPRGGAGDLHLVPRAGRNLIPVRRAVARRRGRGGRP